MSDASTWQPPTAQAAPAPHRKFPKGVIALVAALALLAFSATSGDEEPAAADLDYRAFGACKELVIDRLRSPSSASFLSFDESTVSGSGNGPYTVMSSVDAQNGFGADIRSDFRCVVTLDGGVWRLRDLSID